MKTFCAQEKENCIWKLFTYDQKFQKIYDFVKNNKRFPYFKPFTGDDEKWTLVMETFSQLGIGTDFTANLWNKDYEKNLMKIEKMKKHPNAETEGMKKVLEYFQKAVIYQNENLVFPTKANWFNDHSKMIFMHLKN